MKTSNSYTSTVKLLKTHRYRTYQFYGEMLNNTTKPENGLKIAALTCLSWIRNRLEGNTIPDCLMLPSQADYLTTSNEDFKSFNIAGDYVIDVIADMEDGIWALRIIENDLGALSGTVPVPGRTIQSDVAFRIIDGKLQCGFKTTVSDKDDVEKASCIRFSLIKELCLNETFGLRQIVNIFDPVHMDISNEERLNEIYSIFQNKENQLPFLIYTYNDFSDQEQPGFRIGMENQNLAQLKAESVNKNVLSRAVPYANRNAGNSRPFFLPKRMFKKFNDLFSVGAYSAGDVIVIDPKVFGGRSKVYLYEDKEQYRDYVGNFTREKNINFKDVLFVDEAKIITDRKNSDYVSEILAQLDETTKSLEIIKSKISRAERINDYQKNDSTDVNKELEETLNKLQKSENTNLVLDREISRLRAEIKNKNDYIAYIDRWKARPEKHKDIPEWISSYKYVVLDKKAVDCLNRNDAENVDLNTICDSLDYMEYLYSQHLFEGMSKEELNNRSSNIYNRPFEVSPSGIPSSAKGECKVKYAFEDGIRREYPLDWHLKAGNHGELIRIYFIIDKNRKKIIVGSLPNHLKY